MQLYEKLSRIGFLKNSYAFKFLFVAFIGIHIPLIGLLFFVLYASKTISADSILIFALIITLLATAVTLFFLKKLIKPIEVASRSLIAYRKDRTIPSLPTNFSDEAGLLMSNIQESIADNENFITEKQDLVYLLSHDLRNFVGNSKSAALLILEEDSSDYIKELAELIVQSSGEQFHYIESFITLLKEQDQIIKRNSQDSLIQFSPVFSMVAKQLDQVLVVKNIKLVLSIDVQEALLSIDDELLIRVLVNVIDNAIKFSYPNSEIEVHVYLDGTKLYLKVKDTGVGFVQKQSDELFKKFTKMSMSGTSNEPSTGIGLYLCKNIVERHNGVIYAQSSGTNKGATFSIVFDTKKG
ncbi:HAMP domain-containing histidine kinase [Flavobacterium sp. GSP27]|uniref:histidine kinase n=1 Tax=Flavobacterium bomense TaxID=2497483 RepID=A0A432CNY2_9FLAO|nr:MULTISPECIES: HAMP domain-containing sensor histidine kinase [Flavobacterium]RTY94793.1 HAMP domain-containing histidine kinase [Flavobacterium sp. GSN2]RTY67717.1 HAMP domain-containing histidine kinase [Flavobacterium sp. LB2P53]RTY73482.1 HAMP domain-containing histidine kinase [Flavobacterium sp. LS1R10]RTY79211.1 HAMP domain-containing histidine kinase [Flavobacterium sp. LS1P28]RTY81596.1 HAMP domain-containing histidine kinase [Flavobacterium sp. ZB4P23]